MKTLMALGAWCVALFSAISPAAADALYDTRDAPVIRIAVNAGSLVVRSWDRPQIGVTGDAPISLHEMPPEPASWLTLPIPARSALRRHHEPPGEGRPPFDGRPPLVLPAESFVVNLGDRPHPRYVLSGDHVHAMITLPQNTALLVVTLDHGHLLLQDMHSSFVSMVYEGVSVLDHVTATGFAQSTNGVIHAVDSDFPRVRLRTGVLPIILSHCRADQIDATSIAGNIIDDDASFGNVGPARFESETGDIAIGAAQGAVQIKSYSESGRFASLTGRGTKIQHRGNAVFARMNGRNGATVTATTAQGGIFLYDGALDRRRDIPLDWSSIAVDLERAERAHRDHRL